MFLSVIIPTRDRSSFLKDALDSIVAQSLPPDLFEVLVIDNGSSDQTSVISKEFARQHNHVRYLFAPAPGLHVGRNLGAKEARGDILVYADDDIIAFPGWLEHICRSFENHPEAVLVGGKCLPKYEIEPPVWSESLWVTNDIGRVNGWLSLADLGEEVKRIPAGYVYGCNFSIRKSVFHACKGFHPDSLPGDLAKLRGDGETYISCYVDRNNLVAMYNPLVSVYHRVPAERLTKKYFCRRAYLQAISYSYSITRKSSNGWNRMLGTIRGIKNVILDEFVRSKKKLKIHWFHYIYGLLWHQLHIAVEPALLAWIKKEHYL